jgi:uncharacterized protein YndB with AHSA1/START domain
MASEQSKTYEIKIDAAPSQVWEALVNPDITEKYYFDTRVDSEWHNGSSISYRGRNGAVQADGTIIECKPSDCLCTTFVPRWVPDEGRNVSSKVTWRISRSDNSTMLRLTEEAPERDPELSQMIEGAWQPILARLKQVVEQGTTS